MMETLIRGDLPEFTNPNAYQMLEIGEYIYAIEVWEEGKKLPQYVLCNKKDLFIHLGMIKWYGAWRKFCFYPISDTIWDNKCLEQLLNFINDYNSNWKKSK